MIDGQPVGGSDITADDHNDVGAGQRGTHDARRLLVPVGPKHEAAGRVSRSDSVCHVENTFQERNEKYFSDL